MNSIASQPINLLTENPLNEINRMIVARVLYEFNSSQHATNALVFGFSGFGMHGVLAETGVGQVVLLGDV